MRVLALILGCTPTVEVEGGMVQVAEGVVRLGRKQTPPVPGFTPPALGPPPLPSGTLPDRGLAPGGQAMGHRPVPDPPEPREVLVSTFWIDRTEVTNDQYAAFLADTGYRPPSVEEEWAQDGWSWAGARAPRGKGDHPVVLTNAHDARAFCAWAQKRLPTEAEWQLAVLGAPERSWPWGDGYDGSKLNHGRLEDPNYDATDGWERTSPVGSFPPGANGLYDGFGNAWEWTADLRLETWDGYLGRDEAGRLRDPRTGDLGLYGAVRGGAFFFDLRPNPAGERSAFLLELRRKSTGFRCARDA